MTLRVSCSSCRRADRPRRCFAHSESREAGPELGYLTNICNEEAVMATTLVEALLRKRREANLSLPASSDVHSRQPHPPGGMKPGRIIDGLGLTGSEHVLEIGPGPGFFSVEIARSAHRRPARPVRPSARNARQGPTAARAGWFPRCRLYRGEASDGFPFPDNSFDVAYLAAVIGEVPDQTGVRPVARPRVEAGRAACFRRDVSRSRPDRCAGVTRPRRARGFRLRRGDGKPMEGHCHVPQGRTRLAS